MNMNAFQIEKTWYMRLHGVYCGVAESQYQSQCRYRCQRGCQAVSNDSNSDTGTGRCRCRYSAHPSIEGTCRKVSRAHGKSARRHEPLHFHRRGSHLRAGGHPIYHRTTANSAPPPNGTASCAWLGAFVYPLLRALRGGQVGTVLCERQVTLIRRWPLLPPPLAIPGGSRRVHADSGRFSRSQPRHLPRDAPQQQHCPRLSALGRLAADLLQKGDGIRVVDAPHGIDIATTRSEHLRLSLVKPLRERRLPHMLRHLLFRNVADRPRQSAARTTARITAARATTSTATTTSTASSPTTTRAPRPALGSTSSVARIWCHRA